MKPTNSLFIGTSPELELALYTICFTLRPDKNCFLSSDGQRFLINTHTWTYKGKNLVGSAFPEI
jgi:poly(U)-specific endoribonuclease